MTQEISDPDIRDAIRFLKEKETVLWNRFLEPTKASGNTSSALQSSTQSSEEATVISIAEYISRKYRSRIDGFCCAFSDSNNPRAVLSYEELLELARGGSKKEKITIKIG
jgi:hypothetical protein